MNRLVIPAGGEDDFSEFFGGPTPKIYPSTSNSVQQTCLMNASSSKQLSNKQKKRTDFFKAKDRDRQLGQVPRPQDQLANRDFFVDSVKRNLGLGAPVTSPSTSFDPAALVFVTTHMDSECTRKPTWIDTEGKLELFRLNIHQLPELAVDFEFHNDHSFEAMTSLMQVSSTEADVVIDPFPINKALRQFTEDIMTNVSVIKVFCGGSNDFIMLKRVFRVVPVACLDIQILDKYLKSEPFNSNMRSLKVLTKEYVGIDIPKGETCRDWRRRPLPPDLVKYAQHDTYYALAVFQKMKQQLIKRNDVHGILNVINITKNSMIKVLGNVTENSPNSSSCSPGENLRNILVRWRLTVAKLVDDTPVHVLSDIVVDKLVKTRPTTEENVVKVIGNHAALIKGNVKGLLRIIKEKKDFFSNTICNKCGVRGHCAMMCNQPINRQREKDLYKANPQLKTRQNNRRRKNKKQNKRLKKEAVN